MSVGNYNVCLIGSTPSTERDSIFFLNRIKKSCYPKTTTGKMCFTKYEEKSVNMELRISHNSAGTLNFEVPFH